MRSLALTLVCLLGCNAPAPAEVRLLTYNLNFGNPNVAATLDAIEHADADVVLLQEINSGWELALRPRFVDRYRFSTFHVPDGGVAGFAVLSRLPFTTDERLSKPPGAFYFGHRLVVTTASGPLQILHVHLRAPIDDACFARGCTDMDWVRGALTTGPIRLREIELHWERVDHALPTIVAGDFNESAAGDVVKFLERQGLTRIASTGPTTWHEARVVDGERRDLLAADIDHVMTDSRIEPIDARVLDAGTSDHRPVLARVRLRKR